VLDRSTIRIAFRTLARHKGFTVVAILSIAVAIALNTVMYSVLDAILSPRINARQPELVYSLRYYSDGLWGKDINPKVYTDALLAGMGENVEDFAGSTVFFPNMRYRGETLAEFGDRYKRVSPEAVTNNYFDFLGSVALQGRTFRESDEQEASPVAVISDRLAKQFFPDASPIGETVTLDGDGFVVIGVVERTPLFRPLDGDFWILRQQAQPPIRPNFVRVKEVLTGQELAAQLKLAAKRLALASDQSSKQVSFVGKQIYKGQVPVNEFYFGLVGSVLAILLVACANLANLQLARGLARTRELALRAAVGASRGQLIRLLLFESSILAVVGLAFGIVLTVWGMKLVNATMPEVVADFILRPQTSWRVFAFAAVAALICLFIVGLVPAISMSRVDPNEMLKAGAGTGANKEHRKRYGVMIVAQVGFALPVLVSAIVLLRGAWEARKPDMMFRRYAYDVRPMLNGSVPIPPQPDKRRVIRTLTAAANIVERAVKSPGVIAAAASVNAQPDGNMVTVDGADGVIQEKMAHQWGYRKVTSGYLRTVSLGIARGRDFTEGEADGNAVILDHGSAMFLFKNDNPIGRAIKFGKASSTEPWLRVVGVIDEPRKQEDVERTDYTTGYRLGAVYRTLSPRDSIVPTNRYQAISVIARARGSTDLAAARLQRNLRSISGLGQPTVTSMLNWFGYTATVTMYNFVGSLFTVFALIGLSLVSIGMYGIVTHSVTERRRELAVRISLGATSRHILHAILREGNVLLLAGMALGLLLAKYIVRWMAQFAWGWDIYNAPLYAVVGVFLFGIATLAAYVPALRATRIDPVDALRHE
jgi:putative ABC transport system permease protein